MCGELAGEPLALPILLGMGLDEFSMNPPMIPLAKQIIRNLNTLEMKAISDHVLNLETPAEIKAYIKEEIPLISEITG